MIWPIRGRRPTMGASGEARGGGRYVLSLRELRKVRLVPAAGHGALPALQDGAHPRAPALCRLRLDASPAARRVGARHDAKALLLGGPSLADPPPRRSCAPASCSGSGGKWPSASKFRGNSPRWRASALIRIGATWANAPWDADKAVWGSGEARNFEADGQKTRPAVRARRPDPGGSIEKAPPLHWLVRGPDLVK